jgi:hypothetical protein
MSQPQISDREVDQEVEQERARARAAQERQEHDRAAQRVAQRREAERQAADLIRRKREALATATAVFPEALRVRAEIVATEAKLTALYDTAEQTDSQWRRAVIPLLERNDRDVLASMHTLSNVADVRQALANHTFSVAQLQHAMQTITDRVVRAFNLPKDDPT